MPSKFTEERCAFIVEKLKQNPSLYSAAAAADVTYPTLTRWIEQGEEGDPKYMQFALDVQAARRQVKDEIVQSLFEIATDRLHPQAVKAAKELLTCLYPREFSSVRHVVQHRQPDPTYDLSKLSQDEQRQLHATLKKITSGEEPDNAVPTLLEVGENRSG
jgi:hypothetical protein